MSFKVGDWVYYDGSVTPTQIRSIGANFIYMSNQYTTGKDGTSLKLWQPQVGDFVVKPYNDDSFIVFRYKGYDYTEHDTLQPFIGTLPTFIEEIA